MGEGVVAFFDDADPGLDAGQPPALRRRDERKADSSEPERRSYLGTHRSFGIPRTRCEAHCHMSTKLIGEDE